MTSYTEELKSVRRKREAIERLISFAQQIARMASGMEAVQNMARPSQIPKKGAFALIAQLAERLSEVDTDQLKSRLAKLDDAVRKELKTIVKLSQTSEEQFFQLYPIQHNEDVESSYDLLIKELQDFRRKAQTDVAIRFVLHDRGVLLEHARLPFDQESLNEHAENLKSKESKCRQRIRKEVETLITDLDKFIEHPHFPEPMLSEIHSLREQLQQTMKDLDAGRDIEEIPSCFEIVDMGDDDSIEMDALPEEQSEPEPEAAEQAPEEAPASEPEARPQAAVKSEAKTPPQPTPKPAVEPIAEKKRNFFIRVWVWLTSPWNVGWKDIR